MFNKGKNNTDDIQQRLLDEESLHLDSTNTNTKKSNMDKYLSKSMIVPAKSILKKYSCKYSNNTQECQLKNSLLTKKERVGHISFHEDLVKVYEVENWKKYNTKKEDCCTNCLEICNIF